MKEIIKIEEHEGVQVVLASDLYVELWLYKSNWKRWVQRNITENVFVKPNYGWWVHLPSEDTPFLPSEEHKEDFVLTLDFAARLAMQVKNERGEMIRKYFVLCEKRLHEINKSANNMDSMTIEQILYLIDVINCFKFVVNQKAAEAMHKDIHGRELIDSKNMTTAQAYAEFHTWRNKVLEISEDDLDVRLKRYYSETHPYAKNKTTKRDIIGFLDKYDLVKIAAFDFIKGSSKRATQQSAMAASELAKSIAVKMNVEIRPENIADIFHKQEVLNGKILSQIEYHLPEGKQKRLAAARNKLK